MSDTMRIGELTSEINEKYDKIEQQWSKYTERDSSHRHNLIKALNLYFRIYEHELSEFQLSQFSHMAKMMKRLADEQTRNGAELVSSQQELVDVRLSAVTNDVRLLIERIRSLRDSFRQVVQTVDSAQLRATIQRIPPAAMQSESLKTFLTQWDTKLDTCLKPVESHRQLSYFVGSNLNNVLSQVDLSVEKFNELVLTLQTAGELTLPNQSGQTTFSKPAGDPFGQVNPSAFVNNPGMTAPQMSQLKQMPKGDAATRTFGWPTANLNPVDATENASVPVAMETLVASLKFELRRDFEGKFNSLESKIKETESLQWQIMDDRMSQTQLEEKMDRSSRQITERCAAIEQSIQELQTNLRGKEESIADQMQKFEQLRQRTELMLQKLDSRQQIMQQDIEAVWQAVKETKDSNDGRLTAFDRRTAGVEVIIKNLESKTADLQMDLESTWTQIKQTLAQSDRQVADMSNQLTEIGSQTDDIEQRFRELEGQLGDVSTELEATKDNLERRLDDTTKFTEDRIRQIWIRQQLRDICQHELYERVNEDAEWRESFVRLAARQLGANTSLLRAMADQLRVQLTPGTTQFTEALEFLRQWALKRGGYLPLEDLIVELLEVRRPPSSDELDNRDPTVSRAQHPGSKVAMVLLSDMQRRLDQLVEQTRLQRGGMSKDNSMAFNRRLAPVSMRDPFRELAGKENSRLDAIGFGGASMATAAVANGDGVERPLRQRSKSNVRTPPTYRKGPLPQIQDRSRKQATNAGGSR